MIRYIVKALVGDLGEVTHTIRAPNIEAAKEKMRRAYSKRSCEILKCENIGPSEARP